MNHPSAANPLKPQPWWKFGFVWMIFGGPAIVVVASFVTLWLAIRTPDPVIDENYYQHGMAINKTLATQGQSLAPAMQGRNHAATPAEHVPR